ncbi:protein of unknown function [Noviherbaspirillum humi]|uniref:DUF748 domain-containing protein n=1 Tax=Noviherbaspirillum humi TaxID=1688639 RepID=A0A239KNJ4_9BURK|nr:DUF748 domain-containing protein [Noviherbaspirillum humi]SNT19183.1 protein of unknown function [Noviherbaspirillum humi]
MATSSERRTAALFQSRLARILLISAGVIALLLAALYLALPPLVKWQAEKLLAEKLHRPASIGNVEIRPFALALTVRDFRLMEPDGKAVFASFDTLAVDLAAESVLKLAPVVQEVRLEKPLVSLVRRDAHRYNIDDLIEMALAAPPSDKPARFSVNNIRIDGGRIDFHDQPKQARHSVTELALGIPFVSSLPAQVNIFVEPLLRARVDGTPLELKGRARPFADTKEALLELDLDGLDLTRFVDYLPFQARFKMPGGRLDTRLVASFSQAKDQAPLLKLSGKASLKSLRLTERDGAPLLKLPELALTLGESDILGGRISLPEIVLTGLEADVIRERDGGVNLQRLLPPAEVHGKPEKASSAKSGAPLRLALGKLELRDAALRYADRQAAQPIKLDAGKLNLALRELALDTGKRSIGIGEIASARADVLVQQLKASDARGAASSAPSPAQPGKAPSASADAQSPYAVHIGRIAIDGWSARVEDQRQAQPVTTTIAPLRVAMKDFTPGATGVFPVELDAGVNKAGRLKLTGDVGLSPLRADLATDLKGLDLLPLQPFFGNLGNIKLARATLSGKGRLQFASSADGAIKGGFRGDVGVDNFSAVDAAGGSEFLRWQSLALGGMDMQFQPFGLALDNVALRDFFARVAIDASGRLNLQNLLRGRPETTPAEPARPPVADAGGKPAAPAPQAVRTAASGKEAQSKLPPIRVRRMTLEGGRVRFTDNFIKPSYSASLMKLGGSITGLSSDPASRASVELAGEVNGAPLSVAGRVNPLAGNLFLDLQAKVRGMELAALSPYADRYIGYGIEKGKLSFEVAYRIEQRQLSASNRLILNQLTLNEKAASSAATRLPVKLAIALLQDRDGVIDINVPVDGTLDDPQFSVGGIVLKVIGNAIARAVTQPFAMLGSLFGGKGAPEMSALTFEPGRSAVPAAGESSMETLAKALNDRPKLQLEITGWADPEADVPGLKRASIERKVRALKVKDMQARGQAVDFAAVTVSPAEYPELLARAYKEEKFEKPRNLIGLAKGLPVPQMEQLMLEHAAVDEDDLETLANRRAQAARDWLIRHGVAGDRIFLVAPRTAGSDKAAGAALAKAEFSLR